MELARLRAISRNVVRARGSCAPNIKLFMGLCHKNIKNEFNKCKNHFYEMKGDVGMSSHEKGREQEDAYTKTESHS